MKPLALCLMLLTLTPVMVPTVAQAGDDRHYNRKHGYGDQPRYESCREFTRTQFFERGRPRVTHGTACQRRNGAWVVVSETAIPSYAHRRERVVYHDNYDRRPDNRRGRHRDYDRDWDRGWGRD